MLKSFFSITFIYNAFQIYEYVKDKYSYQYEDWLINYSHGFVRRGFVGEILIQFTNLLNFNLQFVLFVFLLSLLAIFYYSSYKLFTKIKLNNYAYLFLIFSPFYFSFYLVNHNSGIRKEFIIFLFFSLLASKVNLNNIKNSLWFYSLIFPVFVLIHEGLMFYFPLYALSVLLFLNKSNFRSISFQLFISLFVSLVFFYLSFLHKGSSEHVLSICNSVQNYVKETCTMGGAINQLRDKLIPATLHVLKEHDFKSILQWLLIAAYAYVPIFYIIKKSDIKKNFLLENLFKLHTKKILIILLIICFVCTIPLFVVAFDWGRWLSIYCHIVSFILIFLIKNKIIFLNKNFFKKINYKIIIVLILYSTFITPSVFDKKSSDKENVYKLNYIHLIKKLY